MKDAIRITVDLEGFHKFRFEVPRDTESVEVYVDSTLLSRTVSYRRPNQERPVVCTVELL